MLLNKNRGNRRTGAIMILLVLGVIGLFGLLALAIDIGIVAVARSQCQNAADTAAMTGARTVNGDTANNQNLSATPNNAVTAAIANKVLGSYVQGSVATIASSGTDAWTSKQVVIEAGTYGYVYNDGSPASEGFTIQFPRSDPTEPYSAVRATVNNSAGAFFARVFGSTSTAASAFAIAVHRPRDVLILMDLSGSMRFQSLAGIPLDTSTSPATANASSGNQPRTVSMNPETIYPQFGHYSATASAALFGNTTYTTGAENIDPANISVTSNSGPPICQDFYANASGVAPSAANRAFARTPDTQATAPGGYDYLKITGNTGATYATNVNDVIGTTVVNTTWETKGYDKYNASPPASFHTEGPGYWGKTMFIWPPDPRSSVLDANNAANHANNGAKDWRQRFFFKYNTSNGKLGWLDHTTILFNDVGTASPATYSSPNPTPIIKIPGSDTTTVTENGASVTYYYRINYAAFFQWLRNETPVHFPNQVRGGRIKFYDAIPDPSDTTLNNRFWTTQTLSDLNERFWRDYVNFVLGVQVTGFSGGLATYSNVLSSNVPIAGMIGNGDYYSWGTLQLKQKPDVTTGTAAYQSGTMSSAYASGATGALSVAGLATVPNVGDYVYIGASSTRYRVAAASTKTSVTLDQALSAAAANGATIKFIVGQSIDYKDNPYRPKHQFWFGPMTWVDWLGNYNTSNFNWPGNVHEAQAWACKVGISSAIDDIKTNHPNDYVGMSFFSAPKTSQGGSGHHNTAIVALGRNYQQLKDSLWFPPSTVTGGVTEITIYDADNNNVPRANGGTAPQMAFMMAYNQLSSSVASLRLYSTPTATYRGAAGGLGRKGASRLIIFETDGAPNTAATATIVNSGTDSYYPIRIKDPVNLASASNVEWPSNPGYSSSPVYNVVKQIVALDTASPPGMSTARHPAYVYPLGYGSMFDPANPSGGQNNAMTFLQTVGNNGGTAPDTNGANFPDWQRIYGTNAQRITRMQAAFSKIMQSGIQVSLID